jgi:hypothetical protein
MTRRRPLGHTKTRPAKSRKAVVRRRRALAAKAIAGLLVLAAAVVLGVRMVRLPRARSGLVPREVALTRGLTALEQGQDQAAEGWFRRGLESAPGDPLLAVNLTVALNNECFRVSARRGTSCPVLATSRDRFRAAQECLKLYQAIEATLPPGMGLSHDRAQLLDSWGFPMEALEEYGQSQAIGDTSRACRDAIARVDALQRGAAGSPADYAVASAEP